MTAKESIKISTRKVANKDQIVSFNILIILFA